MPKLSDATVKAVYEILSREYPDPRTELTYDGPFQLLVAVVLSAQCTDARVNQVTPILFSRFPTAESMARATPAEIEKIIHSCGFYRQKTKSILATAKDLVEKFNGQVPQTLDELVTLAGVGRKTASVVLNQAFDEPAIAVDTHVARVSHRLGWTKQTHPEKIEKDLRTLLPQKWWSAVNGMLILHGRKICKSQKPRCETCPVRRYCVFFEKEHQQGLRDELGYRITKAKKLPKLKSPDERGKRKSSLVRPNRRNGRT